MRCARGSWTSSPRRTSGPRTNSRLAPGGPRRTVLVMDTVIVTGASRGLGLALARALAERGFRLVIDARDPGPLEAARAELAEHAEVIAIDGDVAVEEHRRALVEAA